MTRNKRLFDPLDLPWADSGVNIIDSPNIGDDYFRRLPDDPVQQAIKAFETYQKSPLRFIKYELGIPTDIWKNDSPPKGRKWTRTSLPLCSYQRTVIQSLIKHKKVAVKSGHGVGKTRISGIAALYLHYGHHALGITTAPTFRQVRRLLWGEIHDLYNSAPRKFGSRLFQTSLESGDKWFIEGFSTRDPSTSITGFHEENIFIIIDEAGGVAQEVYDSMEGILTSENSYVLLIGNPLDANSPFAEAFREDSDYFPITISCYDSPNVKNGWNIYPKLTSFDWPERMAKKWGEKSNLFKVRVLGEFPDESKDALVPFKHIELAVETHKEYMERTSKRQETLIALGVDVARKGSDSTVLGARWKNTDNLNRFEVLEIAEKQRVDETIDLVMRTYDALTDSQKKGRPVINVDDIGLGGGVTDVLIRKGYPVNGIDVGEGPETFEERDEMFLNKRAQYFWKLREMFARQEIGLDDDETGFELSKIDVEYTDRNRIKVEKKDNIRKKLQGRSPDRADCLMLTFAEEEEISSSGFVFWV